MSIRDTICLGRTFFQLSSELRNLTEYVVREQQELTLIKSRLRDIFPIISSFDQRSVPAFISARKRHSAFQHNREDRAIGGSYFNVPHSQTQ